MTWNWYNDIKKQERDMEVGSTQYAKDKGNSVKFIQWKDDRRNPEIPKTELNAILDEYEGVIGKPIERLRQITMSSGPNQDFVAWYNKKMGVKPAPPEWMERNHSSAGNYHWA